MPPDVALARVVLIFKKGEEIKVSDVDKVVALCGLRLAALSGQLGRRVHFDSASSRWWVRLFNTGVFGK